MLRRSRRLGICFTVASCALLVGCEDADLEIFELRGGTLEARREPIPPMSKAPNTHVRCENTSWRATYTQVLAGPDQVLTGLCSVSINPTNTSNGEPIKFEFYIRTQAQCNLDFFKEDLRSLGYRLNMPKNCY